AEAGRVDVGGERDGQLSPARDVDVQPLIGHPARDLDAQKRLACVVDGRLGADAGELALQGLSRFAGARACNLFVDDVEGGAEFGDELARANAGELQLPAFAAASRGRREHARVDLVRT